MSLHVISAGLQSTVQGGPRRHLRHFGIPASGAADPLSLALANRLLGNHALEAGIECTISGMRLGAEADTWIAVTGAESELRVGDERVPMHCVLRLRSGDVLSLGPAIAGARSYVAVAGGIRVPEILGSRSTYLPARFGGHEGRALSDGDRLPLARAAGVPDASTPADYRPHFGRSVAVRATRGDWPNAAPLFDSALTVGRRADRMGIQLDGLKLEAPSGGRLPSTPVFPGCVQCADSGTPYALSVDAQTTGGYRQVAQVIRADRHLLGQLRPGDRLRLAPRSIDEASRELEAKIAFWSEHLDDCPAIFF